MVVTIVWDGGMLWLEVHARLVEAENGQDLLGNVLKRELLAKRLVEIGLV